MQTMRNRQLKQFVSSHDYPCWCGEIKGTVFCAQLFRRKFIVLQCDNCGTQRILPRALGNQADAQKVYNHPNHTRSDLPSEIIEFSSTALLKRIQEVGIAFEPGMTVIDIGCSDGTLLENIRRHYGCTVIGIDVDTSTILGARQRYPQVTFLEGLFHERSAELPKADVAIASAILEHVTSPVEFFNHLRELLMPEGKLFVLTPNSRSRHYKLTRSWWRELLAIGEHIYLFDQESLENLASRAGFKTVQTATDYDHMNQAWRAGSLRDLMITVWSLARNAVKLICKVAPKDAYGDILYASLKLQPLQTTHASSDCANSHR